MANIYQKKLVSILCIVLVLSPIAFSFSNSIHFVGATSGSISLWQARASTAWNYFEVGSRVSSTTGLCWPGAGWPYFHDWDLATYLFAIMDAEKIGLVFKSGTWGADDRINRVIGWLETRALMSNNVAYSWYDARTGLPTLDLGPYVPMNTYDYGGLLVALHRLKEYRPDLASRIDYVVKTRENTTLLASQVDRASPYDYYIANGYNYFGFGNVPAVVQGLCLLKNVMGGPFVNVYGVLMPRIHVTSEPVLLSFFKLDPDPLLSELCYNTYLSQEARFNATAKFTAFSEGNTELDYPSYIYEYIVTSYGTTWVVDPDTVPIAYLKVAYGFDALYGSAYTASMINYFNVMIPSGSSGYKDGVTEAGRTVNSVIDRTNGLVIAAARFAIEMLSAPDLGDYPEPFVGSPLEATFVIGDTNPHGARGWGAYTTDNLGAIGMAGKLGQFSSSGSCEALLDSWLCSYNSSTGYVTENWAAAKYSNFVSVGASGVNMLSYDFDRYDGIPFYLIWIGGQPFLHSALTNKNYTFSWAQSDAALIACLPYDGKIVLLVWGLTAFGTLAACQVLQYFDSAYSGLMLGRAVIVRWSDSNGNGSVDLADNIVAIERWS